MISAAVRTEGYKIATEDVRIIERQNGDSVELIVKVPERLHIGVVRQRRLEIAVTVPANTQLDLRSSDGSIRVFGTRAPASLSSGDGSIEVSDFEGPLQARTSDGSIRAAGRFDNLDLQTSDGSIQCEVRPGSRMANRWQVHSGDGSIRLRLPQEFAAELDAHASDGRVRSGMPVTISGKVSRNAIRGKLNSGGQLLEVSSGDGSISIDRW